MRDFEEHGYVVVEDLLDPATDLDPVLREYEGVLDRLVDSLVARGRMRSPYRELDFDERLLRVYAETGESHWQDFEITLPVAPRPDTPMWTGPAVFAVLTHPRVLDAVETLIGPEVVVNPVQHMRIKPQQARIPESILRVHPQTGPTPWHQDQATVRPDADGTEMLTVWIAVTPATVENGCLQVVPGSHRRGLLPHCNDGLLAVTPETQLGDGVPVPLPRGGAILMHRRTCHSAAANRSAASRWSFDLRYNPAGQPTGRDELPAFLVRSRSDASAVVADAEEWARAWGTARERLAMRPPELATHRWQAC